MISTLGGLFNLNHFDQSSRANDVIVIRHKDGSLHSTPFNVRFGRAQMWNYAGRVVQVEVNGELTTAVMKIGKGGETYWLQPTYGAFGQTEKQGTGAKESTTGPEQRAAGQPVANASAGAQSSAAMAVNAAAGKGPSESPSRNESSAQSRLRSTAENPSLSVDASDLAQFSIHPESPPELPAANSGVAASATAGAARDGGAAPPAVTPSAGGAATPSKPPGVSAAEPGSPDSVSSLPLLHRGDDGHLVVETRAIHSAEDVQEARLALQAMAAAEKSRRRLSKLLLKEDAFFLQSAEAEGQLDSSDDGDDGAAAEETAAQRQLEADALAKVTETVDGASPPPPPDASPVRAADGEDAQAAPASPPPRSQSEAAEASPTKPGGEVAIQAGSPAAPPQPTDAASLPAASLAPQNPPRTTSAARPPHRSEDDDDGDASSAGSGAGSIDSYKVEDEDDYFLDPIDADDYAAMYGAEELLKNVSFASSVTSGVSLTDANLGGSASDLLQSSPSPKQPAAAGANASRMSAPAADRHDSPLKPGKGGVTPAGVAGAGALPAASASVPNNKATASRPSTGEAGEILDAEGRVVHLSSVAAAGAGGPYFTRTLIPVEADLWKLHLKEGCNKVRYLARKDKGEIVSISCNIFLWNWTDRLVVSDVDGTITKSDLLGHFYAMLGKGGDWTHPGICNLYSKIERNGYRMVYLTARSVSQINQTKSYLFTLQQDGVGLPLGPVLTAPQRFFTALTQEVSKQSHVFKIACLTSVRAAFPPHTKPFFAGFGNRYNDVISYDAVSIPTHKIFIIDPSSVLHVCLVKQTYRDLGHLVDVTFPPVKRNPVVLRAPRHAHHGHRHEGKEHTSAAAGREKDKAHHTHSQAGGSVRAGGDRHAYARSLLHRSASASSSSSSSSYSSSVSASTDSLEPVEQGSGSSQYSAGDVSANSDSSPVQGSGAPSAGPHHHHHHHHHHRQQQEGEEGDGLPVRHASVAFSLFDSFPVLPGSQETPSSSTPASAIKKQEQATPPLSAAQPPTAALTAVAKDPPSASVLPPRVPATTGHPTLASAPASSAAVVVGDSKDSVCDCFSGVASPYLLSGGERAGPTAGGLREAAAPASTVATAATGTGQPTRKGSATDAPLSRPAGASTHTMGSSTTSSNASLMGQGSGPKYNYGQRSAGSSARGVGGAAHDGDGGGGGVAEEEEEVPVDPDFSSYAYWRMDPRDLIAPAPKPATKPNASTSAPFAAAAAESSRSARNAPQGEAGARGDAPQLPAPPSRAAETDTAVARDRRLASPVASQGEIAAAAESTARDAGGAIEAQRAGAAAAAAAASSDQDAAGQGSVSGGPREKEGSRSLKEALAATPEVRHQQGHAALTPQEPGLDRLSGPAGGDGRGVPVRPDDDSRRRVSLTSPDDVAVPSVATSASAVGAGKPNATRRGFFSAFSFGRGQASQPAPESPNTARQRAMKEEAKRKALAHPDAWEYYRTQQEASATDVNPLAKGPSAPR